MIMQKLRDIVISFGTNIYLINRLLFLWDEYKKDSHHYQITLKNILRFLIWYCNKRNNYNFYKLDDNKYEISNLMDCYQPITNKNIFYYNELNEEINAQGKGIIAGNFSIDYSMLLNNSLKDIYCKNDKYNYLYYSIETLIVKTNNSILESDISRKNEIVDSLNGFLIRPANSFDDALQRILFYNMLLWQTGHKLNGLGRLDLILNDYYVNDIRKNIITKEQAKNYLKEFFKSLHNNYRYKSNVMSGDTGQVIILGGKNENNEYMCNDLTYLFIEVEKELCLPDPKLLLRVSENIPDDLLDSAVDCISTGIGSPLLANDDIIIDRMIEFGYDKEDAYDYTVSACWEPTVCGKSAEINNSGDINFCEPLMEILNSNMTVESFDDLVNLYEEKLSIEIKKIVESTKSLRFQRDDLVSAITYDCISTGKNISEYGARYNNIGILSVGLSNTINSLNVINELVFNKKIITFEQLKASNNNSFEDISNDVKHIRPKFGHDDSWTIGITSRIFDFINRELEKYNTEYDQKFKLGLSSPNYIIRGIGYPATPDGRKFGEAFGTHISADDRVPLTELINFAASLNYAGCAFNGNVVDYIFSKNQIVDNRSKIVSLLKSAIKRGFFEIQFNVLSYAQLVDAKANPERYKNLIVRVWGFSAYFVDLPEEYKNLLIKRAAMSEGISLG